MNLWKSLPTYPTKEDVIYELSCYLAKDGRPGGEFTMQTFNSVFGTDWAKTKYNEIIEDMINAGDFLESGAHAGNQKYKLKEIPRYSE